MSTHSFILTLILVVLAIVSAGCTGTPADQPQENGTPRQTQESFYYYGNGTFDVNGTLRQVNGTLHISSLPSGAEVWIDNEYWCPTNCALGYVIPPGRHTVEIRKSGYESVTHPVTVVTGGMEGIRVTLVSEQTILPATGSTLPPADALPHISASGSWTYGQGWNKTIDPATGSIFTDGPVPLVLHAEAANDGAADARVVTASATIYSEGQAVSRNPVDFGTIAAGSRVSRDIPVSWTPGFGYNEENLAVLIENVTVKL